VDDPAFDSRTRYEAVRGLRGFESTADGLWRAGALEGLLRPTVAIVGTRAATPYGRRLARDWAYELGRAGCCIISGLALGIDAAAHQGALDAQAPTVGVLGGGHRCFFPARNRQLATRMIESGGAVLSPFPADHSARPGQFLERNGIVAALADAVVVVEAPARSGAINTAGWAAGRIPVLAVPGDVDRAHSQGCLALIRDGATLARHSGDVLEALGAAPSARPPALSEASADPIAAALLEALAGGERDLDDLVFAAGCGAAAVLGSLTVLELDGSVERRGPNRYARASGMLF
jgi:DNA processing protein